MARKLENQQNVEAPDSDYPYGRIRDNEGANDGTPLNEAVHGDYHQFFARILAESGVVANEMPDNDYLGFQYYEGLLNVITKRIGRYSIGDSVAGGLSDNFNEFINAGIFKVIGAFSNKPNGLIEGMLFVTGSGNDVLQRVVEVNGAEWSRSYTGSWSAWVLIKLAVKVLEIGDWDMDATAAVTVSLAGVDFTKVRKVSTMIRSDSNAAYSDIQDNGSSISLDGSYQLSSSGVTLRRVSAGDYDSPGYATTSFNRGWVTIEYDPA